MKMITRTTPLMGAIDFLERREMAVFAVANHVQKHGLSLLGVVEALCDEKAEDAVMELIVECSAPMPSAEKVLSDLGCVLSRLMRASLDEISKAQKGPADLLGGLLWHGSRLSDYQREVLRWMPKNDELRDG